MLADNFCPMLLYLVQYTIFLSRPYKFYVPERRTKIFRDNGPHTGVIIILENEGCFLFRFRPYKNAASEKLY